ncbi:MAG: hypothetical protein MAG794_01806 [Gammaproteobacteria bacterium]|nr:hypothetical protein [Gammaproteobacteria bacterium]
MKADFHGLVERAMEEGGYRLMRPVIEKELLHYDVLFALDQGGFLDRLTFQGGTALRLCYDAPRFSEDLDFVGGRHFSAGDLSGMADCIYGFVSRRYGLEVKVKAPKPDPGRALEGVEVNRWRINVITAPARPDLPQQKIRIEVVNIPAYTGEPMALRRNYAALPDGYADMLISTETLSEIMADKLVALIATKSHVRYRDIWDLRWLSQQGANPEGKLLCHKLEDYRVNDYPGRLEHFRRHLPDIVHDKAFRDSMVRFLPTDVVDRTFDRTGFLPFLERETDRLLTQAAQLLAGDHGDEPFQI